MPKIKTGEVITRKEFFKRWKQGIEGISLLQQTQGQIQALYIIIIGIIGGIIASIIVIKTLWWLLIILIGSLYNIIIQLISLLQKRKQLKTYFKLQMEVEHV